MPSPAVIFGFILATLYGALFHLISGGNPRRLALYLLAGWLGFALGQIFGNAFNVQLFRVGVINVFSATLGAWIALFLTRFLTGKRPALERLAALQKGIRNERQP
ncbi:MAG: hypothetical protein IAE83_06875 [Anaerolinea sp.]|nr:hypothetical protein [Anaerolinea sp.]MCC6976336.1 hypothetical protein [Anaerolineae bacterium]CAG1008103.1 hypothetical protein ANRL4_03842 [Anaerolineae bacterium]